MTFRSVVGLSALVLLAGCQYDSSHTRPDDAGTGGNAPSSNAPQAVSGSKSLDVKAASSAQCPAGGMIYSVYLDANSNGVFDSDEEGVTQQIVCSGVNGQNGADGANGADGTNGVNGANGFSMVFAQVAAPSSVCAAGGSTLLMALDVLDGGVYSSGLPNQQSMTICNGVNGQNGTNGINGTNGANAPVPAFSPVEAILACGVTVSYKEVLLRLSNGQVLGSFSDNASGANTRLAFLPDGSYVNTDGSGCTFSLSTSGGTRSISWIGQVQMSWPVQ